MVPCRAALTSGQKLVSSELPRADGGTLKVYRVPPPSPRPSFLAHPRLRRASPISHYAVAAALEALGLDSPVQANQSSRIGIIFCVMTGCVNYSRRFYDEVLKEPATASPMLFPETVLNAPASHLAAVLCSEEIAYTLVGDGSMFVQGLATAAEWLCEGRVDRCVVVGAEEIDWLVTEGVQLFNSDILVSEGAGALCLERHNGSTPGVGLAAIGDPVLFTARTTRWQAAVRARKELQDSSLPAGTLLCDGLQDNPYLDRDEARAWSDWAGPRLSPKRFLGEGLAAASAWQCVAAVDALRQQLYNAAQVSVVGLNQQAIVARFQRV